MEINCKQQAVYHREIVIKIDDPEDLLALRMLIFRGVNAADTLSRPYEIGKDLLIKMQQEFNTSAALGSD